MAEVFKLHNKIKHYAWGSTDDIPRLLGMPGDGSPCAELWMGSHLGSPSIARLPSGDMSLGELIASDPSRYLGEKVTERFGALPFLFKLLAAQKPLSIQAHPNLAQAREGFERENTTGIAVDAPNRNYKDPNHKPEIICALTPFTGMCGFREPGEIQSLLAEFLESSPAALRDSRILRESFAPLIQALQTPDSNTAAAKTAALQNFLSALFGLSPTARQALTEYILLISTPGRAAACEWDLIQNFARLYPGDPAVISPLYLNVFRLEPGEAIFLKAGVLHAYISGFGVELMANSDNVLRGGLTGKHIDVPELMKVLEFSPLQPQIMKPTTDIPIYTYPVYGEEFALQVICGCGSSTTFSPEGPSICIVTNGELTVRGTSNGTVVLKQGESAFIPPLAKNESPLTLEGHYTLHAASCGMTTQSR